MVFYSFFKLVFPLTNVYSLDQNQWMLFNALFFFKRPRLGSSKLLLLSPTTVPFALGFVFFFSLFLSSGFSQQLLNPRYVLPKQLDFDFKRSGDHFLYSFKWRNSQGTPVKTVFSLHSSDVEKGNTEFRKVGKEADREIVRRLQLKADELGRSLNARVTVSDNDGLYSLRVEGRGLTRSAFQYVYNRVQEEQKNVVDAYLKESYYSVEPQGDKFLIRPDYRTLVNRYRPVGKIIAKSLLSSSPKDLRGLVQHSLDFVQSIPYGREMNDGADFQTPIGLFTDNMGDCDTKAVALGTFLESYGIDFVFLLTKDHLFMGIDLPKFKGDRSFTYGGKSYILAEPAGEGFPLGMAYPESLEAFKDGKLEVIAF